MMYGYGYHHDWAFGGLGMLLMLLMLLILVALLLLIVAALKYLFSAGRERPGRSTALDILDQAYARGEIQHEEYLQKRQNLLKK